MARVADGHTSISGHPGIAQYFGEIGLPLEIRWMDGTAVVTSFYHDSARAAGIVLEDSAQGTLWRRE